MKGEGRGKPEEYKGLRRSRRGRGDRSRWYRGENLGRYRGGWNWKNEQGQGPRFNPGKTKKCWVRKETQPKAEEEKKEIKPEEEGDVAKEAKEEGIPERP